MTPRPYWDYQLPPTIQDAASLAADLNEAIEIWRADLQPLFRSWTATHRTVIELLEDVGPDDLPALRRIQEVCAARAEWVLAEAWVTERDAWQSLTHVVRRVAGRVERRLATRHVP